jgi:hypothetical protein
LTWGTANKHVEIAFVDFQLGADFGGVYVLDTAAVRPSPWMVVRKCTYGLRHKVISIEALEAGFPETLGDAAGSAK